MVRKELVVNNEITLILDESRTGLKFSLMNPTKMDATFYMGNNAFVDLIETFAANAEVLTWLPVRFREFIRAYNNFRGILKEQKESKELYSLMREIAKLREVPEKSVYYKACELLEQYRDNELLRKVAKESLKELNE